MLKKVSHIGPSLAVKYYKDWCICSQGPFIEIFDFKTGKSVNRCQIFKRNKVHGFSLDTKTERLVVYGARSVSILSLSDILSEDELLQHEKITPEWILHGEFSFMGNEIYLLTSYNRIIITNVYGDVLSYKSLFGECSILYSGSIKVTKERVFICAGTIMNGIIIWDCLNQTKIHNLNGHEGSIFYVTMSNNGKLISSCSDDRSIKVWSTKTGELLSTAWGHTARIWSLKFFNNDTQLISVSEDCTCRVWNLVDYEPKASNIFEVSLTKNTWAVDVDEDSMTVVTGGNDGRLKLTDLKTVESTINRTVCLTLQEISDICPGFECANCEIIKGFHWFNFGLVLITSEGNILQYIESSNQWKFLKHDPRFFSFSIVNATEDTIILMNNKCLLSFMQFNSMGYLNKTMEMTLDDLTKTINCLSVLSVDKLFLMIESPNPSDPLLCLKMNIKDLSVEQKYRFKKPVGMISSCIEYEQNHLLVGARFSTTYIFDLSYPSVSPLICKTPSTDAVTSISTIETAREEKLFSITNRDGNYHFISLNFKSKSCEIIHSNKVNRGFLEGSYFDENEDLLVYGFKSNLFHIYNESQQYEIFSVPCGGAHRQWKLCRYKTDHQILCFVKNSSLNWTKIYKSTFPETLKNGTHGREIRDLSIRKSREYKKDTYLFISGSEDTTVKLCSVNVKTGFVKNYWTLKAHVSGLQRCKFLNEKLAVTCSAREELFLWELNDRFSSPHMNLRKKLLPSMNNPDLRIMDFDFRFIKGTVHNFIMATVYSDSTIKVWHYDYLKNEFLLLIQGKYETCCILNVALAMLKDSIILLIAATDGYLTHWDITDLLPFEMSYGKLVSNNLSFATLQLNKWTQKIPVHLAGIKSFDLKTEDDRFVVYTGGDDNAIAITEYTLSNGRAMYGAVKDMERYATSSTVTSVQLLDDCNRLLTTSVDQIIRIWDIGDSTLSIKENAYTTVADTGSSDFVDIGDASFLLIGGVGLSGWMIE